MADVMVVPTFDEEVPLLEVEARFDDADEGDDWDGDGRDSGWEEEDDDWDDDDDDDDEEDDEWEEDEDWEEDDEWEEDELDDADD